MKKLPVILFFILMQMRLAHAQDTQVWLEYMLNYPFANSWNVELASTYSTVLAEPKWRSIDMMITPEYAVSQHVDVMAAVYLGDTFQEQDVSTFEIREMVGTRIHLTPNRRLLTRVLFRYEQRNIKYLEQDTWQHVVRPRVRLETVFPLNKLSMFAGDKLLYTIVDGEWFFNDKDVDERFANRFRLRAGLGYRINYNFRVEFVYTLQQSKNTLEEDFYTSDHILRFRLKHYLRKSKPALPQGTGN